ncbi:Pseudouridine synthase, TruD [Kalmanozyma brasiliensis GHG001]|uniref:TRUD domain-containing protein n=1 Tax=Kalmanozyma brasiliensis (strain GHG001) TaxID=1365824 RepID=V5E376_KALBG|nr:Pseudouridine synthase, TruD [Kalmanozyma brasiliensis GHG001]EST04596.1 Pseudouridine synthase, TruD [Kalmanozyma brasiliensis GHG001]
MSSVETMQDAPDAVSSAAKRVKTSHDVSPEPETRMTEARAGITAYIAPTIPGFQGIIKQRFTDFMVNEIDPSGVVCRLTSLEPPPGKLLSQLHPSSEPAKAQPEPEPVAKADDGAWPLGAEEKLSHFFAAEAIDALKDMWSAGRMPTSMATGANATIVSAASIVTNPLEDKAQRTQVHQLIRELFGGKLATDSLQVRPRGAKAAEEDEDARANGASSSGSTRIAVRWANRSDRRAGDGLSEEANNAPPYIHFLLHKTNRDHQEAMGMLAEALRLGGGGGGGRGRGRGRGGFQRGGRAPTKVLDVAGTKDKRAVTVQRVSLRRNRKTLEDVYRLVNGITADHPSTSKKGKGRTVVDATTSRGERGIRIGHLSYADAPLKLGQLKGNEFTITLRNVRPTVPTPPSDFLATMNASMATLRDRGFINYFGMQRFGTGSIPTHHIGIHILRNDFKGAITLLFDPRPPSTPDADDGDSSEMRKAKELYWAGAYDEAYHAMPRGCTAEKSILDKMRGRWTKGDWTGAFGNVPRTLRLMYVHAYQSYVWNRLVSERVERFGCDKAVVGDIVFADDTGDDWGADGEGVEEKDDDDVDEDDLRNGESDPVPTWQRPTRVLTQSDIDSGRYTIYDILIPLPGSSITLPSGWMSDLYHSILTTSSLTPDDLTSSKIPEYQLKGSYRRILVRPTHFSHRVTTYTDPDIPLTYTDEERCLDPTLTTPPSQEDGAFTALTLNFQLPSSSYATMLMREALKSDTSSFKHRQLTQHSEDQQFKGASTA